jgi:hypothetical protein
MPFFHSFINGITIGSEITESYLKLFTELGSVNWSSYQSTLISFLVFEKLLLNGCIKDADLQRFTSESAEEVFELGWYFYFI